MSPDVKMKKRTSINATAESPPPRTNEYTAQFFATEFLSRRTRFVRNAKKQPVAKLKNIVANPNKKAFCTARSNSGPLPPPHIAPIAGATTIHKSKIKLRISKQNTDSFFKTQRAVKIIFSLFNLFISFYFFFSLVFRPHLFPFLVYKPL